MANHSKDISNNVRENVSPSGEEEPRSRKSRKIASQKMAALDTSIDDAFSFCATPTKTGRKTSRKNPTPQKVAQQERPHGDTPNPTMPSSAMPLAQKPVRSVTFRRTEDALEYLNDSNNFNFETSLEESFLSASASPGPSSPRPPAVDTALQPSTSASPGPSSPRPPAVDTALQPSTVTSGCHVSDGHNYTRSPNSSIASPPPVPPLPEALPTSPLLRNDLSPPHCSPIGDIRWRPPFPLVSTPLDGSYQPSSASQAANASQAPTARRRVIPSTSSNHRQVPDLAPRACVPRQTTVMNPLNIDPSIPHQIIQNPSNQWIVSSENDNDWTSQYHQPVINQVFQPPENPFRFDIGDTSTSRPNPLIFFRAMWPEDLFARCVTETNVYAFQKTGELRWGAMGRETKV